jgi:hypothetical protein
MRPRFFKIFFIVFAVVIIATASILFITNSVELETDSKANNTTQKLSEKELRFNKLFSENKALENLIKTIPVESSIRITSPVNNDTLKSFPNFRWNSHGREVEYTITLLNNNNKKIWQRNTNSNSISFRKTLEAGLYYWKVDAEGETKAVGKFFVK